MNDEWLTGWLNDWFTCLLGFLNFDRLIERVIDWFIPREIDWLGVWLIEWMIDWWGCLIDWLSEWVSVWMIIRVKLFDWLID